MNWNYIIGFFDADGSITLTRNKKNEMKTIQISFHNNEVCILDQIRYFIIKELNVMGTISRKNARKRTHQDSYDLKYSNKRAYDLLNKLKSIHPKKSHRIKLAKQIQRYTPRNGKYTNKMRDRRIQLEAEFFNH